MFSAVAQLARIQGAGPAATDNLLSGTVHLDARENSAATDAMVAPDGRNQGLNITVLDCRYDDAADPAVVEAAAAASHHAAVPVLSPEAAALVAEQKDIEEQIARGQCEDELAADPAVVEAAAAASSHAAVPVSSPEAHGHHVPIPDDPGSKTYVQSRKTSSLRCAGGVVLDEPDPPPVDPKPDVLGYSLRSEFYQPAGKPPYRRLHIMCKYHSGCTKWRGLGIGQTLNFGDQEPVAYLLCWAFKGAHLSFLEHKDIPPP